MTLGVENVPPEARCAPRMRRLTPGNDVPKDPDMADNEGSEPSSSLTALPVKSGSVYAVHSGPGGRQIKVRVVLKVYVSSFGRYAVVSQEKAMCKDCGFINLKHCNVKKVDNNGNKNNNNNKNELHSFQIIPRNADGQLMTFSVQTASEAEQWVRTLDGSLCENTKESYTTSRTEALVSKRILSPSRRPPLAQLSSLRVDSPVLSKKSQLPALEEE